MEAIQVYVGQYIKTNSGFANDTRRTVKFVGEQLGSRIEYGEDRGRVTDSRGVTETLYRTDDGRLVVHVEDWSHWANELDTLSLHEVTKADLTGNGRFALLGQEAGFCKPLSLDEALTPFDLEDFGG